MFGTGKTLGSRHRGHPCSLLTANNLTPIPNTNVSSNPCKQKRNVYTKNPQNKMEKEKKGERSRL